MKDKKGTDLMDQTSSDPTLQTKQGKTQWHRIFAKVLKEFLTPVKVSVQPDVKVMVNPPEADLILLGNQQRQ